MQTCRNCGGSMQASGPGRLTCEYCGSHVESGAPAARPASAHPRPASPPRTPPLPAQRRTAPTAPGPWPGITGMVLGIVGVALSCVPGFGVVLSGLALVFGFIGIRRRAGRAMATAAIVLGLAGVALFLFFGASFFLALLENSTNANGPETPPTMLERPDPPSR